MTSHANKFSSLGTQLAPLFASRFFRPLARPSAAIYVDCAERLIAASDETKTLSLEDARSIIRDVLAAHPDITLEEDEGAKFSDMSQRTGQLLNRFYDAQWLQERRTSVSERSVLVSPEVRMLVSFLGDLVQKRPADLKNFAGTLRSVCDDLLAPDALNPDKFDGATFRQKITDLLSRVKRATDQLHQVENIVLDHERQQRTSASAGDTLRRVLIDFHEGEHIVCYNVLSEAGLLKRIREVREVLRRAADDYLVKQRLAQGIATEENISADEAFSEAGFRLRKLEKDIGSIPTKQGIIDGRISDFSNLSAARYRYQTEMRGRQSEHVQNFLAAAARSTTGRAPFSSIELPTALRLRSVEVKTYFGSDSLFAARRRRVPANLDFDLREDSAEDAGKVREEMRRQNLRLLSARRAARFVEKNLPQKGARISTQELHLEDHDALLDFLSALCFDRATPENSRHTFRWRIVTANDIANDAANNNATAATTSADFDNLGAANIERLFIERLE